MAAIVKPKSQKTQTPRKAGAPPPDLVALTTGKLIAGLSAVLAQLANRIKQGAVGDVDPTAAAREHVGLTKRLQALDAGRAGLAQSKLREHWLKEAEDLSEDVAGLAEEIGALDDAYAADQLYERAIPDIEDAFGMNGLPWGLILGGIAAVGLAYVAFQPAEPQPPRIVEYEEPARPPRKKLPKRKPSVATAGGRELGTEEAKIELVEGPGVPDPDGIVA